MGWIMLFIGMLIFLVGFTFRITTFHKKKMGRTVNVRMPKKQATIILIIGLIFAIAGMVVGQSSQNKAIDQHNALVKKQREEQAAKAVKKQKNNELMQEKQVKKAMKNPEHIKPGGQDQLTPQQYALSPDTIEKMYQKPAQTFFDTEYNSDNQEKEFALKTIGKTVKNVAFHTTDNGQVARLDNLTGNDKKIILIFLNADDGDCSSTMNLMSGMKIQYPNVHFITIFPKDSTNTVKTMMQKNNVDDYNLIVTKDNNQNVDGKNNIMDYATKYLNINEVPAIVAVDKNSRIPLVKAGNITSPDIVTRFINLSFNSTKDQILYNQLKTKKEITNIQNQPNQAYVAGDHDGDNTNKN